MHPTEEILDQTLRKLGLDPQAEELEIDAAQVDTLLRDALEAGKNQSKEGPFQSDDQAAVRLFRQLMDYLPDLVYFKDKQSRFLCVNRALANYFGYDDPNDLIGKSDFDLFATEEAQRKFEDEQQIILSGEGWSFREESDSSGQNKRSWVVSSKLPLFNEHGEVFGTFGLSRDITAQKHAELDVQRQQALLNTIVQILPCRLFLRDRSGHFILVNQEYRKVVGIPEDFAIEGKHLKDVIDDPRVDEVLEEDLQVVLTNNPIIDKLEFDKSILAGNRWVLTSKVPLKVKGEKTEGIVGMSLDITEQVLAEQLAERTRIDLQYKSEQYEEELQVARQLQEQLMSMGFDDDRLYLRHGSHWQFRARYLYKPSHHLAGDFFQIVTIDPNCIGVLICDVMGHGVKAALVTMLIRGLLAEIPDILGHPGAVLQHLNHALYSLADDEHFPRFVTGAYLTLDLERGEAAIANAAHPNPLIRDAQRDFVQCPCESIGPALGLIDDEPYEETRFKLEDETEIFLFTDGIIEQLTKDGEEFGLDGLASSLRNAANRRISEQIHSMEAHLTEALAGQSAGDDLCVIALKATPQA